MPRKLNDALNYATTKGFWIVPMSPPPDEQPLAPLALASRDPDQIRAWWQRWPNASVGCPHAKNNLAMVEIRGDIPQPLIEKLFPNTMKSGVGDIRRYYYRMHGHIKSQSLEIADDIWIRIYGSDAVHALPAYRGDDHAKATS